MVFFKFMNLLRLLLPVVAVAFVPLHASAQETTLQGEPFGYVKVNITPGTGTVKRSSYISIPLLEDANIIGGASGRITALTSNTITSAGAGWASGELSAPAEPYLIEITSGKAQGRFLMVSTAIPNTSDTLTIDAVESMRVDLSSLEIAAGAEDGDTFKIRPVDTLKSFFGTPDSSRILGGSSVATADSVKLNVNGSTFTYYFNTNSGRWTGIGLGASDASNVRLPPYSGLQYERLSNAPLSFIVTGRVPSGRRMASIKASGTTIFAPHWPIPMTLGQLALQNVSGWLSGSSAAAADTLIMSSGGSTFTYYHNGTSWRSIGLGGGIADSTVVPVGASLLINRRGSAPGYTVYRQNAPYSFE
jgi:uncharacterized protein (TIGR02597 family)